MIEVGREPSGTVLEVDGTSYRAAAEGLSARLRETDPTRPVTLDFRSVTFLDDWSIVRFVNELLASSRRSVARVGMVADEGRLVRYVALSRSVAGGADAAQGDGGQRVEVERTPPPMAGLSDTGFLWPS